MTAHTRIWRVSFLVAGALLLAGGPRHPGGTMAEMLAHPDWLPSHVLMTAAFAALAVGLTAFAWTVPAQLRTVTRVAAIAAAVQAADMVVHTAAMVDLANLLAARSTPVLSTHIALTAIVYPLFAAVLIWFVVVVSRARAMGSPWIGWIAVLGVGGHGMAGLLVAGFDLEGARVLFPWIVGLAVWMILAAVWPAPSRQPAAAI